MSLNDLNKDAITHLLLLPGTNSLFKSLGSMGSVYRSCFYVPSKGS